MFSIPRSIEALLSAVLCFFGGGKFSCSYFTSTPVDERTGKCWRENLGWRARTTTRNVHQHKWIWELLRTLWVLLLLSFSEKNKGGKFRSSHSFPRVDSNIHFFLSFLLFLALFWGRRQRSFSSTKKAKFIHPRREIVVEFICVRLCDCVVWCEKLYHFHLYSSEQQQQNEMIWGPRRFSHLLFFSVSTFFFILVHNSLDLVIWEKTELCSTGAQNLLNQAQRQKWREKWDRNRNTVNKP